MGFLVKALVVLVVVGMVLSYLRRGVVSGSSMRPAEARELLNIHVGATADEDQRLNRIVLLLYGRLHATLGHLRARLRGPGGHGRNRRHAAARRP